jgi:hypothetical protein
MKRKANEGPKVFGEITEVTGYSRSKAIPRYGSRNRSIRYSEGQSALKAASFSQNNLGTYF